jgi:hypothetical protein
MWWVLVPLIILLLVILSYTRPKLKVGIASLMRDPHHLDTWIDFHLKSKVSKVYIFWDSEEEPPSISDKRVFIQRVTPEYLTSVGFVDNPDWDNPLRTNAKQDIAVNEALKRGEVDYMFHIDGDELLYTPDQDLPKVLEDHETSDVDTWRIENIELAPDSADYENCFTEGKKFRRYGQNFVAYGNGKGCGRVGHVASHGPHYMRSLRNKAEGNLPFERVRVLHFVSCNLTEYLKKYQQYGTFKDDKWEWAQFHLKSRDNLTKCENEEDCKTKAREMFKDRLIKPDEQGLLENPVPVEKVVYG